MPFALVLLNPCLYLCFIISLKCNEMKKEFVIWGIRQDGVEEEILLTQVQGVKLHSIEEAEFYLPKLSERGCTGLRIQEIDFSVTYSFI